MRRYRVLLVMLAAAIAAAMFAGANASAAPKGKLKYYFKSTGQSFVSPSGKPLSNSAPPAAGDQFSGTDDLYVGNSTHHAKTATASAVLDCVVTSVPNPNTEVLARCEGVIAIGGSLIYSISTQNFASSAVASTYPITGGAGIYRGAKGSVKTTDVGKTNNSNGVISIH